MWHDKAAALIIGEEIISIRSALSENSVSSAAAHRNKAMASSRKKKKVAAARRAGIISTVKRGGGIEIIAARSAISMAMRRQQHVHQKRRRNGIGAAWRVSKHLRHGGVNGGAARSNSSKWRNQWRIMAKNKQRKINGSIIISSSSSIGIIRRMASARILNWQQQHISVASYRASSSAKGIINKRKS